MQAGVFPLERREVEKRIFERSGSRLPLAFHGYILSGDYVGSLPKTKTDCNKIVKKHCRLVFFSNYLSEV